jgi:uncharacterized protein (TIGR03437 family)
MTITARKIFWGTMGVCAALVPALLYAHYEGPDVRHTGAPGDVTNSCATSQCHTAKEAGGPVNSGGGGVAANFSSGSTYIPGGSPITITVTVSDPTNTHYGFQMTARLASNLINGQAGTFTPSGKNQIVLCDDNNLRPTKGCAAANPVEFIEHSFSADSLVTSTPYTFTWTPPATNVGNVHFYVAGNSVNLNDQADSGDHVYTNDYVLAPGAANPPSIVTGGVLNAASFAKGADGFGTAVSPGSLVSIFASNFGTAQADFSTIPFPINLGGVNATVSGTSAPLRDVIPAAGIVNAQIPFATKTGSVNVVLTTSGGSSAAQVVTIVAQAPGLFTIPPGVGNAILVNLTDGTVAGPANANIGLKTNPIPRGTFAFFYATGLGVMTPPVIDGDGGSDGLTHTAVFPLVTIGGVTTQVLFAGQAPGFPGVYQVNIQVPANAPTGNNIDLRIFSQDGTQMSPPNVATISVR